MKHAANSSAAKSPRVTSMQIRKLVAGFDNFGGPQM